MLTVDYDRLGVGAGTKVIDVGCGAGRHSYEAYRRGADVIAFDQNAEELAEVDTMLQAMGQAGEAPAAAKAQVVVGDALALPASSVWPLHRRRGDMWHCPIRPPLVS